MRARAGWSATPFFMVRCSREKICKLTGQRVLDPAVQSCNGIPSMRQEKGAWMGHGACISEPNQSRCRLIQNFSQRFSSFFLLWALTLNQMGVPSKPKAARIWFSRKRSKLKCSLTSRSAKSTKVGGATAACVM